MGNCCHRLSSVKSPVEKGNNDKGNDKGEGEITDKTIAASEENKDPFVFKRKLSLHQVTNEAEDESKRDKKIKKLDRFVFVPSSPPSPLKNLHQDGSKTPLLERVFHVKTIVPGSYVYKTLQVAVTRVDTIKIDSNASFEVKRLAQKQLIIKDVLQQVFPSINITFDKKITAASRSRPDYVIPAENFTILVECDEFQHRQYTLQQELDRMRGILLDLRNIQMNLKCIFLRFNPDMYMKKYKRHACALYKDKDGMLAVDQSFRLRLAVLIERIRFYQQTKNACEGKDMLIEYMFYDSLILFAQK